MKRFQLSLRWILETAFIEKKKIKVSIQECDEDFFKEIINLNTENSYDQRRFVYFEYHNRL